MIETIEVQKRDAVGSWAVRKLRSQGLVPAILYGHGEENVCLAVKRETVSGLIRHGARVVALSGAINETALLRDVQWDTFGSDVIHIDFARVSQTERVEVTLPIHVVGEAPGVAGDAQLIIITHEIDVECPAADVPEYLNADVSHLQREQSLHVSELKLPEGMVAVTPGNVVIAQVAVQGGDDDADTVAATAGEPEVITKGKGEEAGEG